MVMELQLNEIKNEIRKLIRDEIKGVKPYNEWLTKKDACRYLGGLSMNSFDTAVIMYQVPRYKVNGRILFKRKDLDSMPIRY